MSSPVMKPVTLEEAARRAVLMLTISSQNHEREVPYCFMYNELMMTMDVPLLT